MYEFDCLTESTLTEEFAEVLCRPDDNDCFPGDNGTCNPEWPCNPDLCNPGP